MFVPLRKTCDRFLKDFTQVVNLLKAIQQSQAINATIVIIGPLFRDEAVAKYELKALQSESEVMLTRLQFVARSGSHDHRLCMEDSILDLDEKAEEFKKRL